MIIIPSRIAKSDITYYFDNVVSYMGGAVTVVGNKAYAFYKPGYYDAIAVNTYDFSTGQVSRNLSVSGASSHYPTGKLIVSGNTIIVPKTYSSGWTGAGFHIYSTVSNTFVYDQASDFRGADLCVLGSTGTKLAFSANGSPTSPNSSVVGDDTYRYAYYVTFASAGATTTNGSGMIQFKNGQNYGMTFASNDTKLYSSSGNEIWIHTFGSGTGAFDRAVTTSSALPYAPGVPSYYSAGVPTTVSSTKAFIPTYYLPNGNNDWTNYTYGGITVVNTTTDTKERYIPPFDGGYITNWETPVSYKGNTYFFGYKNGLGGLMQFDVSTETYGEFIVLSGASVLPFYNSTNDSFYAKYNDGLAQFKATNPNRSNKSLVHFDGINAADGYLGGVLDYGTNGGRWTATATTTNATYDASVKKFGTSSLNLSGGYVGCSMNFMHINYSGEWKPFTFDIWYKPKSMSGTYPILSTRTSASAYGKIGIYQQSGALQFQVGNDAQTAWLAGGTAGTLLNDWNHIAACGDGTNIGLYLNGVKILETKHPNWTSYWTPLVIGYDPGAGVSASSGYYDEFRYNNSALYSSNFTPPTQPFD